MESSNFRSTQVIPRDAKRHILHIEDDPGVAEMVKELLDANGYIVTQAADGLSGLLAFQEGSERWSAVLIDLNLPHVDGKKLIQEMHQSHPDLPLIVLTGAEEGSVLDVYGLGAVILWHKPISSTEILENLKALLN